MSGYGSNQPDFASQTVAKTLANAIAIATKKPRKTLAKSSQS